MNTPQRRRIGPKIKPPKKHGPEFSVDVTWAELSKNIREILNHNASSLSFEENHRYAYNMVLYKHGDKLYRGVISLVSDHLGNLAEEEIVPVFPAAVTDDPASQNQACEVLLKTTTKIWEDFTRNLNLLRQILKYMDRVYVKSSDVLETWLMGLDLFLKRIICPPIREQLVSAILKQIRFDRDGYNISPSTVKGCVAIFLSLDIDTSGTAVYKTVLEPAILEDSKTFYQTEGERLLEACDSDATEYLRRVESRFKFEDDRAHFYLSPQTWPPLEQILKEHLLTANLENVINQPNSGLEDMIDREKTDDMSRLYRLYLKVPQGLLVLKRAMKNSIMRRGKEINQASNVGEAELEVVVMDEPEPSKTKGKGKQRQNAAGQTLTMALKWVEDTLRLKDTFDTVWKSAFGSDRDLESGLNEAFESFINLNEKASEFISLFIDDHLKRGLKGKTDADIDIVLDKTITVFRYITEKDLFEKYYKNHLAKRLLLGRSVSDDAERGMLAKLKVECGYQFTQKLEGMFNDMKLSSDTMRAYKDHLSKLEPAKVDISVIVMTSSFWPMLHSDSPCNLPEELIRPSKSFEQFYLSRHSGRRLTWQPSLGNADVRVAFKAKTHDINVATFALVILLLFENLPDDDILSYEEIKDATQIHDSELRRHLQSLACGKYKVLKKHPPGRDIDPEDSFSFNVDFTAPLQKFKISTVSSKVESGDDRKKTQDNVEEQRKYQTEACIVRIMKDRKHMTHNDLVNEVTRQLATRFLPNPVNIKKRIEELIDRDYLERCEDRRSYNYLA